MRYVPNSPRSVPEIRAELDRIAEAIDTMLDREGTSPNEMKADLDMDGNKILNADIADLRTNISSEKERFTLSASQTTIVTTLETTRAVFYINGPLVDNGRLFETTDYTITSEFEIELVTPYPAGTELLMVLTEFENTSDLIDGGDY
ncbi:coil containing protein [Vibrio phage 1.293.O._10N.261.52.E1]|nr:coil containing protein [Vibrio phage 1.293.O._10N.261.52.E1]